MRSALRPAWVLASLLIAAPTLLAQSGNARNANPTVAQTAAGAPTDPKRSLTIPEYARWRSIRDVSLSDDGMWATYGYQQRRTDDTLFVKSFGMAGEQKIARASRPQFSDDSKWVAYFIAQGVRQIEQAQRDRRPVTERVELRNLATGATQSWDNAASFAFAKGSESFIVRKARANASADAAPAGGRGGGGGRGGAAGGAPSTVGTDLILHSLRDGHDELIGSVSAAEFSRPGTHLVYTVASSDRDGNGLYAITLATGARRTLDNGRADYTRLTFDSAGTAVAALRGTDRRGFTEKENAVVVVVGVDREPVTTVYTTPALTGVPDKMVISEKAALTWSPDHAKLFVALKEQEPTPVVRRDTTAEEEPVANVDVWHWKDDYIQPMQMVRAQQDRNRTYPATLLLSQKKIVPLADKRMQTVQIGRDGNWGVGRDEKDYIDDWKPQLADYYRVNTTTGERTPILKGQDRAMGLSPDGEYWLYWKDKQVWAYDLSANRHTNITKLAPVSFVNAEEDHFGEKPAYGITGYSKDGKSVILTHKFDLWQVSLDGTGTPKNLTNGVGTKNEIRFRYQRIEPAADQTGPAPGFGGGRGGGGGGQLIDLSKPVMLTAFGEQTKKDGFYELDGDKLTELLFDQKGFGTPIKAKNADRVLLTRETFAEFPDYWVTDGKFKNPQRITNANPQQAEYKWGHRVLIDYKDKDGHKLQGTLAVPDDYKPGERRPMLVYFYEKLSQNQYHYEVPRYASAPAYADYVSNGYLVLLPDVYFHTGRSHTDMLNSVEAAVKRTIELGYTDPKRVGLNGGSYSGQGGAYISTTSKMFAAVAIRAAAVDLVADFNQLWKSNGTNQHRYDTYGQGRFGTTPFDNLELFMDQSAVFHAKDMNTNLLIYQGTNDGSTEWLQGVEFYNALRFLKKPVIFLSYEGEAHGFTRYENQYDVMVRLHQFYDHHLKGEVSPDWMTNGVPFLAKKRPTGAAAQPVQLMGPGAGVGTPNPGGGGGGGSPPAGPPPL